MLNLSTAAKTMIQSKEVKTLYLFDINYADGQAPWRLTDWSEQVSYSGNVYNPWPIKVGEISQSQDGRVAPVSLVVGNIDEARYVQQLVENYDMIGKKVTVTQIFYGLADAIPISFKIAGIKAAKGVVSFTLSIGFDYLLSVIPSRIMYQRFCRWKFKDANCKYAGGDTTCGRFWEDCVTKGNTINFGNFPGLINSHFFF
jgi:phage-related protein